MTQSPETQIPSPAQEVAHLAEQCSTLLRENARLRDALESIALLAEEDGHGLTLREAYRAVASAISALGTHPSRALTRRCERIAEPAPEVTVMNETQDKRATPVADTASQFLGWAYDTFGDIALDPTERTMRFVEEAIELAHAMHIQGDVTRAVVDRVYRRPAGDVARELSQSLATLMTLAKIIGIEPDAAVAAELQRVQSIPKSEWDKRHAAKAALGIALTAAPGQGR